MTVNEFKRWLRRNGCEFIRGGAKHEVVVRKGLEAVIPRHGSHEIPIGTMKAIKKQLGL